MRKLLDSAWFNFTRLFQWHRMMGIGTLCVVTWLLVAHFSRVDIGWLLPRGEAPAPAHFQWPDLPGFSVTTQKPAEGQDKAETVFTVPTRQITPRELSQLPPAYPAPDPKSPPSSNPAQ